MTAKMIVSEKPTTRRAAPVEKTIWRRATVWTMCFAPASASDMKLCSTRSKRGSGVRISNSAATTKTKLNESTIATTPPPAAA